VNTRLKQQIFSVIAFSLFNGCARHTANLPRYDRVPAFTMIDQDGRAFQSSELAGKVWIADFIYTNCPAACPMMTSKMKKLSGELNGDVRLVSISVDPARDTPQALSHFASRYGAPPPPRWTFLTGTPGSVHLLAWSTFHVGDVIGKMEHSTKFTLVDKQGFIRGYYASLDGESTNQLLRDADALNRNNS
jgi:protein SCO1/2